MGSRKKNRRRSARKSLRKGRAIVEEQKETPVESSFEKRTGGKLNLSKNILIVCEGETEAAYFFALKKFLDHRLILGVEILPDLDAQSEDRGSGVSALPKMLDLALEKMQEKDYSEVWIVLDNDEGNGANIYRKDDQVEIQFDLAPFQQGESCCLYFDLRELYPNKGKRLCYIFIA